MIWLPIVGSQGQEAFVSGVFFFIPTLPPDRVRCFLRLAFRRACVSPYAPSKPTLCVVSSFSKDVTREDFRTTSFSATTGTPALVVGACRLRLHPRRIHRTKGPHFLFYFFKNYVLRLKFIEVVARSWNGWLVVAGARDEKKEWVVR